MEQINFLKKITLEIADVSNSHLQTFINTKIDSANLFVNIHFLERLVNNLFAVNLLLTDLYNNKYLENSIGLILRANINDFSTIFTMYDANKNDKLKYNHILKCVIGDNIKRTLKNLKEESKKNAILSLKQRYLKLLNSSGIDIDNIDSIDLNFKRINHIMNSVLYMKYSKYEHFGLVTVNIQLEKDDKVILDSIEGAIFLSLQGIMMTLSLIQISPDLLNNIFKIMNKRSENYQFNLEK